MIRRLDAHSVHTRTQALIYIVKTAHNTYTYIPVRVRNHTHTQTDTDTDTVIVTVTNKKIVIPIPCEQRGPCFDERRQVIESLHGLRLQLSPPHRLYVYLHHNLAFALYVHAHPYVYTCMHEIDHKHEGDCQYVLRITYTEINRQTGKRRQACM